MAAGTTNAFLTWFAEWGQVVYFAAQILFWVAIAAAAVIVALQYKRFVSYKVGAVSKQAATQEKSPAVFAE